MDQFPRCDIERSFRKFNDIVNDLLGAKHQTWGNIFTHLITHCEEDPVMEVITEPLRSNRQVDAAKWYADAVASAHEMVGSGHYELPYNDDDRTALLYQFFLKVEKEGLDISNLCVAVYGTTNDQDIVDTFNRELVTKFAREVSYRLDEILQDVGDQKTVAREAMIVFHHHDQSTTIHGNIQGSFIATSGGSIAGATVTYNCATELATALRSLLPLVNTVAENQRSAVERALEILIAATASDNHSPTDIAAAATTVANGSPTLASRLKWIAGRIGTSLVASTIFQGIKTALGMP